MPYFIFLWTPELIRHFADNDVTPQEFEQIVGDPEDITVSRTSGRLIAFGHTAYGRYLACAYEVEDDGITLIPFTAFQVPEPRH